MRFCSYTMRFDTGFAPNPFWGICTLAACTPNHQGVKIEVGDWIMGHESKALGSRIIYVMKVSEVLVFDEYYRQPRFRKKIPRFDAGWKEKLGDNIYFQNDQGGWEQSKSLFHRKGDEIRKDLKHPKVFIAECFYYFGERAIPMPDEFHSLLRIGRGCCFQHDPKVVNEFLNWLQETQTRGVNGNPRDKVLGQNGDCF